MQLSIEELTLNAWPALQTLLYDGWLLRFANGYTRRANSINPLYPSTLPLETKLPTCERLYDARSLDTVFKLTDAATPPDLDAHLATRGYRREAETSVQLADLSALTDRPDPSVTIQPTLTDDWLAAFHAVGGADPRHRPTIATLLASIPAATAYASLHVDGRPAAVGLGVAEREYVGLFDIVTAAPMRGRGLGERTVRALLAWGRAGGARLGHLAVMGDNAPARRLYAKVGFRESYRYWYRVRPAGTPPALG